MKKVGLILIMYLFSHLAMANESMSPGDVVKIAVSNNPELTVEAKLDNEGGVNFPLIGLVELGGLTTQEASKLISRKLVGDGYLRKADVNISILSSVSKQVSVLGNISRAGKYQIEPGVETVLDLLAIAGGVVPGGSMTVTLVRVNDDLPKRFTIDVEQLLLKNSAEEIRNANVELKGGDVLYIPDQTVFYTLGEVSRAGAYAFKKGLTVQQALSLSGGIGPTGNMNAITITRVDKNGKTFSIQADGETAIKADDLIFVDESLF